MQIITKFSPGDHVAVITSAYTAKVVKCNVCNQTGKITINNEELICPKCGGHAGYKQYVGHKWYVSYVSVIGQIKCEYTPDKYRSYDHDKPELIIQYMIEDTGIGSGTVWYETEIFASKQEAQEECDRRNSNTNWKDELELLPSPCKER